MEIPHIETRWDYRLKRDEYSVNLYPHPSALSKVREKRQLWTSFHIFLWKSAQQTWFCTLTEYTLESSDKTSLKIFKRESNNKWDQNDLKRIKVAKNYIKGWKWPKVQSGQKWPKVVKMIKCDQNDQTWSKGRTQLKQLKFDIKNRDAEIFALQKGESSKIEVKCELFIILMWWLWDEQRPLKKKEEESLFCQRLSKKSLWIHYIRHNISKSLAAFCSSIKRANDDGILG